MKKFLVLAVAALMIFALAACAQPAQPAAPAADAPAAEAPAADTSGGDSVGAKKLAYLAPSFNTPFWGYCEDGINDVAASLGWTSTSFDSNNEAATQLKNAQNAIAAGADAIIISPTDSASCPAVLEECKNSGIPVVICDIGSDSGEYLTLIATPNKAGAYKVGQYFTEYVAAEGLTGVVGEITIPLARINGQNRQNGFQQALDEAGITKTTVLESTDFSVDEAYNQTKNIVSANPDLMAIWSHHSQATLGIVKALEEQGLTGKIVIACFDADPEVVDYIRDGIVLVCGAQQPIQMGREAVIALEAFWNGENVPDEVPVEVLLLTAATIESQIDDIIRNVCPVNPR